MTVQEVYFKAVTVLVSEGYYVAWFECRCDSDRAHVVWTKGLFWRCVHLEAVDEGVRLSSSAGSVVLADEGLLQPQLEEIIRKVDGLL